MYDISSINVLVLKICIHHLYHSLICRDHHKLLERGTVHHKCFYAGSSVPLLRYTSDRVAHTFA